VGTKRHIGLNILTKAERTGNILCTSAPTVMNGLITTATIARIAVQKWNRMADDVSEENRHYKKVDREIGG